MASNTHEVTLGGVRYTWDGNSWFETKSFLRPPAGIVSKLNALVRDSLARDDATITDADLLMARAGIPVAEGHLAVCERDDAAVGEGDPMDVAAQILQDSLRALDGRLPVHHPVLLPQGRRPRDLGEPDLSGGSSPG